MGRTLELKQEVWLLSSLSFRLKSMIETIYKISIKDFDFVYIYTTCYAHIRTKKIENIDKIWTQVLDPKVVFFYCLVTDSINYSNLYLFLYLPSKLKVRFIRL